MTDDSVMAVCKSGGSGECEEIKSEVKVYFVLGGGDDDTVASTASERDIEGDSANNEGVGDSGLGFISTNILTTPVKKITTNDSAFAAVVASRSGEGWKRKSHSVCDPNYSTPRSKSTGFYNHPVKRRLLFENLDNSNSENLQMNSAGEDERKMEPSDSCNTDVTATVKSTLGCSDNDDGKGTDEEEETKKNKDSNKEKDHSNLHHRRRRRKKKRRDKSNAVIHVIGMNHSDTRTITATTISAVGNSTTSFQQQTEGGKTEGDSQGHCGGGESGEISKENQNTKSGDVTTGAPPRRIAQLVVWTKNLAGGTLSTKSGKGQDTAIESGKKETAKGSSNKIDSKVASLEGQRQDCYSATGSSCGGGKKENNSIKKKSLSGTKSSGGSIAESAGGGAGETEADLFFVQYPVRPFADQGKGKGKPFRRLNSYNDPIVIKKTPPPPAPSERKRRGCGEGKRKRNTSTGSTYHNKKESFKEVPTGTGTAETSVVVVEVNQQAQEAYHQAYILHQQHHQQDFNVGQYFQLHQNILCQDLSNVVVTTGLPGSGEIISLPLQHQPHEGVLHCDYIPTTVSNEVIVTTTTGEITAGGSANILSAAPSVTLGSTATPVLSSFTKEVDGTSAAIPAQSAVGSGGEGGDSTTVFDLPERFTVTTNSTVASNEFDLLIQNVVHEELVNDDMMGEEEDMTKYEERLRKRMRLSCGGETSEEEMLMMGMNGGGSGGDDNNSRASSIEEYRGGSDDAGKPRCTYTELIEKALTESGGLTVSEIYNWISERYPYYRQDDDRWKNSVRHNLSINPYFKKGEKARSGAGHLWTISEESKGLRPSMVSCCDERRKSPCDPTELLLSMDNDTDRAVANILGMYRSKIAAEKGLRGSNDQEDGNCGGGGELNTPERCTVVPVPQHIVQCSPPISDASTVMMMNGGASCNNSPNITTTATTSTSCASAGELSLSSSSCSNAIGSAATITLNELNSGQFTVDLSGITIPEGGTINFDELVSNGRLIYIETTAADPDANKENEQLQQQNSLLLNSNAENILAELTGGVGHHHHHHHGQQQQQPQQQMGTGIVEGDVGRFNSNMTSSTSGYFIDGSIGLSLDLEGGFSDSGGGKVEDDCCNNLHTVSFGGTTSDEGQLACVPPTTTSTCSASSAELTMVSPSEVIAPMTTTTCSQQDYAILDQVFNPHSSYEVYSTSSGSTTTNTATATAATSSAAFYESKELGISYTYHQIDISNSASSSMASIPENNHLHHLN